MSLITTVCGLRKSERDAHGQFLQTSKRLRSHLASTSRLIRANGELKSDRVDLKYTGPGVAKVNFTSYLNPRTSSSKLASYTGYSDIAEMCRFLYHDQYQNSLPRSLGQSRYRNKRG